MSITVHEDAASLDLAIERTILTSPNKQRHHLQYRRSKGILEHCAGSRLARIVTVVTNALETPALAQSAQSKGVPVRVADTVADPDAGCGKSAL